MTAEMFEPASWDARYAGTEKIWSGRPNPQLVREVEPLAPGTALDVGCGEGGDVIWLAARGWQVTAADFSANALARTAEHAREAGLSTQVDLWQVDARHFDPAGRTWDLVSTHFMHPPAGGMVAVTAALATAVAPGGHLLVVGHAPSEYFYHLSEDRARAMWRAADLLPALPPDFTVVVAEDRPRQIERDGQMVDIEDATLLVRRVGP
ncbi:MAG TPA: class I SAM-dependent methyltransferase [Solirubrobacteraceae bacterium]|nr:class I SAM-dependent methyltransferase [Solirubrobacteraceae bacterium]